ncbi:site-specific DNA-methyltransferase [Brucella intermedia GD04153]|uniref:Methyltransferase n=1 Tax=Brucella intermedia GD04153 TaxID=2975438 RepID=A0AA42KP82_9HYPH|nr:DNA methyltransferase [Brucella intermedia]MDH0126654.1 site-specific DNA-methyltransferase [Brucella intermedia GD04153]
MAEYNPSDDAKKCYDLAVEAKRERGDAHWPERLPYRRKEVIGDCTLYLGDCMEIMPTLGAVDTILTDPPFSERTHKGHDAGTGRDGAMRRQLGYSALTSSDIGPISDRLSAICSGWICWITDHTLAPSIEAELRRNGRYVFAPLPFYQPGRSVRLTGDGPCSWTDWIIASRTSAQIKWGTLPGGYVAGEGWKSKDRMGGKPVPLMTSMVRDYSSDGQTVLDPFMGAGTTLVACAKLGRRAVGIEIDEAIFDIACDRIRKAYAQPDMFVQTTPVAQPKQEPLL